MTASFSGASDAVASSRATIGTILDGCAGDRGTLLPLPRGPSGVVLLTSIRVCSPVGWFVEVRHQVASLYPGSGRPGGRSGARRRSLIALP